MKCYECHYDGPELSGVVTGPSKKACRASMQAKVSYLDPDWEESVTYYYWNGAYLTKVE